MTKIRVSWNTNAPSEQVQSYKIYSAANGAGQTLAAQVPASNAGPTQSWDLDNPSPGTYAFQVSAVNLAGESAKCPTFSTPGVPSVPGGANATVITV